MRVGVGVWMCPVQELKANCEANVKRWVWEKRVRLALAPHLSVLPNQRETG